MEITLGALEALFDRATVNSDGELLADKELSIRLFANRDSLDITIQDDNTFQDILTIKVPVSTKTIVKF